MKEKITENKDAVIGLIALGIFWASGYCVGRLDGIIKNLIKK